MSARDVVDMRMGNHNRGHFKRPFFQFGDDSLHFISRIDDDGLARLLIAKNRAVALQQTYGEHYVYHAAFIVSGAFRDNALADEKAASSCSATGASLSLSKEAFRIYRTNLI